jgi:transposase
MKKGKFQRYTPEFKVEIAERMVAGENIVGLSKRYGLARSMMYRWRDKYRKEGAAGLTRAVGRGREPAAATEDHEQRLRRRIAELERKVGQQAVEIDFFKGVFKRLEEQPKASRPGGAVSTRKSDG